MAVGKVLQDCGGVIADRDQLQPLRIEPLFRILQLDQLRFAEWSPIGGTEEYKHCAVRSL